jgi:hypothetical protein
VFEGFTFHLLRHTAGSLMAVAGMDPAVAAERMGHTDGGALFLKTYRHLYEGEKRTQANRLDALVRSALDEEGTGAPEAEPETAPPYCGTIRNEDVFRYLFRDDIQCMAHWVRVAG